VPNKIHIADHLILPFGTARKFDLNRIKLSSVAADGIYFTADVPCIYIDRGRKQPLTINECGSVFGYDEKAPEAQDVESALEFVRNRVEAFIPEPTNFQISFLTLYFQWLKDLLKEKSPFSRLEPFQLYNALLPVPEMQIYVEDPLQEDWPFEPTNNFRVDFGFWTGTQLLAIEIDGNDPGGYARDLRRDRLLRRANVNVIHILNTEITLHGKILINALLPDSIRHDWRKRSAPQYPRFPY